MRVFDGHCDVLSKMLANPALDFKEETSGLDVTLNRLLSMETFVQCFAVFVPEPWKRQGFAPILESVDRFMLHIASDPRITFIRTAEDLAHVHRSGGIGAMLTLEGVDGLQGNWSYLRILSYLGVRCVGLTWNNANWAADGVMEPRGGGLTRDGRRLIRECNRLGMTLDVSHLSEKGFWEVLEDSERPLIASHSNAYSVCRHPRNLTDGQITALIEKKGRIGITFVPWFLSERAEATVDDVLRHVEHVCALGGEGCLAFGSDFDGIDRWVEGLKHPGHYKHLGEELIKRYPRELVEGWMYGNWTSFFLDQLPRQAN